MNIVFTQKWYSNIFVHFNSILLLGFRKEFPESLSGCSADVIHNRLLVSACDRCSVKRLLPSILFTGRQWHPVHHSLILFWVGYWCNFKRGYIDDVSYIQIEVGIRYCIFHSPHWYISCWYYGPHWYYVSFCKIFLLQ